MLLLDGLRSINVPLIENTQPLKLFKVLFAHPFWCLGKSHAMQMYQIDPSKLLTVKALVNGSFPTIQSTKDQPTPFITARTIGYIHALLINTLSANNSASVHARALRNETTTRGDLDKWDRDGFCTKFQTCMTNYYKGILKMQLEGASGLIVTVPRTSTILLSAVVEVGPEPVSSLDSAATVWRRKRRPQMTRGVGRLLSRCLRLLRRPRLQIRIR
jgi:hypothetical protein